MHQTDKVRFDLMIRYHICDPMLGRFVVIWTVLSALGYGKTTNLLRVLWRVEFVSQRAGTNSLPCYLSYAEAIENLVNAKKHSISGILQTRHRSSHFRISQFLCSNQLLRSRCLNVLKNCSNLQSVVYQSACGPLRVLLITYSNLLKLPTISLLLLSTLSVSLLISNQQIHYQTSKLCSLRPFL